MYIDVIMEKITERIKKDAQRKGWLHKTEIWTYDEITRYFRDAGYGWTVCQRKADVIMRVGSDN